MKFQGFIAMWFTIFLVLGGRDNPNGDKYKTVKKLFEYNLYGDVLTVNNMWAIYNPHLVSGFVGAHRYWQIRLHTLICSKIVNDHSSTPITLAMIVEFQVTHYQEKRYG